MTVAVLYPASPLVEPYSPEWWVQVLYDKLLRRQGDLDLYQRYYEGNHPAPWVPQERYEDFKSLLDMSRANICGLVVDSTAERLAVEGFRLGPTEEIADADTWRIWQANGMDSTFDQGILEALIGGCSYISVAPNPVDPKTPRISVEHASQAIVAFTPGSNRRERLAGLKVWQDEWSGRKLATLYLPGFIYKYQTRVYGDPPASGTGPWFPRLVGDERWPAPNPLGEVPLYEIPNRPRLLSGGVSELADVVPIQVRINKTIAERLRTQDVGAFPLKWATGYPDEDEDGNELGPPVAGPDRMITTSVKETQFGQFSAAPLDPYSSAKREDIRDAASRTRTPAQYLLGDMSNVNGETLKASESGLVSKVTQCQRYMSDPLEESQGAVRRLAGLPDAGAMETVWRDPQYRTQGERGDFALKLVLSGIISRRQAREDLGYSQNQIRRIEEDLEREGFQLPERVDIPGTTLG